MPATRLTMRKIREVLRLAFDCQLTKRQIATNCSIARSTVSEYLMRFAASGLSWPLPADTDDIKLELRLFPPAPPPVEHPREPPDFVYIHRELRRKAVTLMLLWQEYKAVHPDGYQYSQFCNLYRQWIKRIDPVMRQEHRAGETLCVDWAGMTVPIVDPLSGTEQPASIFVAELAASKTTAMPRPTLSQQLADSLGAHCRALDFFGGVPRTTLVEGSVFLPPPPSLHRLRGGCVGCHHQLTRRHFLLRHDRNPQHLTPGYILGPSGGLNDLLRPWLTSTAPLYPSLWRNSSILSKQASRNSPEEIKFKIDYCYR